MINSGSNLDAFQEKYFEIEELIINKEYMKAKKDLDKLYSENKEQVEFLYLLGKVEVGLKNYEKARSYFEKATQQGFISSKCLVNAALVEKKLGNDKKTVELLQMASDMEKDVSFGDIFLLAEYMDNVQYEELLELGQKIANNNPELYLGYHVQIIALMALSRLDDAKCVLENIVAELKDCKQYICDYLILGYKSGWYEDVWNFLLMNEYLFDVESKAYAYFKANIASKINNKEGAISAFKILSEKYEMSDATLNLALLKMMDGNLVEAEQLLSKVITRKLMDRTYFCALYLHAHLLTYIEDDEDIIIDEFMSIISICEEVAHKNEKEMYVLEFAAECYRYLGNTNKQKHCMEKLQQYYNKHGIDRAAVLQI